MVHRVGQRILNENATVGVQTARGEKTVYENAACPVNFLVIKNGYRVTGYGGL